jgi:hypothetical protein
MWTAVPTVPQNYTASPSTLEERTGKKEVKDGENFMGRYLVVTGKRE